MNELEDWKTMNRATELNKAARLGENRTGKQKPRLTTTESAFLKAQKVNISTTEQITLHV